MNYIEFDGTGYETYVAKSNDLLHWETIGKIMSFSKDSSRWDAHQRAGYTSLQDPVWGGTYALQKYAGRYWMSYIGGKDQGYEAGQLSIGIAYQKKIQNKPKNGST